MWEFFKKLLLFTEFILLFFGIPLFIHFDSDIIHPSAVILPILALIFLYFKTLPGFRFKELIRFSVSMNIIIIHAVILLISAIILTIAVYLFDRSNLFNLPRANPLLFLVLCILYPVFSAYGQEIIYRVFICTRYKTVFKTDAMLIIASSLAFSFVHIVYYNRISVILTFILGLYLTFTYLKTRSVLLTSLIHGILGDFIFAVGLGSYFWLDMYKWM